MEYTTIGYDGEYQTPRQRRAGDRWWTRDPAFEAVSGDVRTIQTNQQGRLDELLVYLQLYSTRRVSGFSGAEYAKRDELTRRASTLSLNVCRSVVNAVTAKIATNRTRPVFLTEGGNWRQQLMGRDLARFIDGQFYATGIYRKNRRAFRDGCIFGTGSLKVYVDWSDPERPEICADRVLPGELWVDDVDGRYGNPSQIYHVREVGREVLQAEYQDMSGEIEGAGLIDDRGTYVDTLADPISQIEAWHLESIRGVGDGRHVMCTTACDLVNEDWARRRFPFPTFRWLDAVLGFFGDGLVAELVGYQVEINKILRKIQDHMDLASSFILTPRGSKVVKEHLRNTPWSVLEYTGDAPTFATVQSISPEYFLQLDRLYAKAFEQAGVTQLFAQGAKPKGLDSGKALREYKDTESERFMDVSQAWEDFHLDIAEHMIDLAREIEDRTPGYSVMAMVEDGTLRKIRFKDVDLDRDKYLMQPKPASAFSKDPAAKFQQVKELLEAIPEMQPYALKLLGYPDLDSVERRITAPLDTIERITDSMIYDGQYEPPDAFIDLEQALIVTRGKYHWAKNSGVPEDRLIMLQDYMDACQKMIKDAMSPPEQAAPDVGPAPGVPSPGPGMPPGGALGPQVGDVTIRPEITVGGQGQQFP